MTEDSPKPLIAYVANVIEEQLHELDHRRVAAKPGPTQVVRPPVFVNESVIYPPLVQQVRRKERMLGGNVTSAELKHVLEANAKALRHGGEPTTLGSPPSLCAEVGCAGTASSSRSMMSSGRMPSACAE